jgi:nucleotide-binding universal stress UspA family protein
MAKNRIPVYIRNMKTILAPVDFSNISDAVVDQAATLAQAGEGRVVLLAVIQPPVVMSEYAAVMDLAEITAAGEKHAARQLERLQQKLKGNSVATESVRVVGSPIAHILDQATKLKADYIVMGSHGHTAFYDLLVGSTTHGVLMRAKCPVVIVPAVKQKAPVKRAKPRRAAA